MKGNHAMRKTICAALALLAISSPASAATTWADLAALPSWSRGVSATCTTGTESAPAAATDGIALNGFAGFSVTIETGGTMTAGGQLLAYMRNASSGNWVRAPDLDLVVQALANQSFGGFTVTADVGRVAYVPSGVGVASTIYIIGTAPRR